MKGITAEFSLPISFARKIQLARAVNLSDDCNRIFLFWGFHLFALPFVHSLCLSALKEWQGEMNFCGPGVRHFFSSYLLKATRMARKESHSKDCVQLGAPSRNQRLQFVVCCHPESCRAGWKLKPFKKVGKKNASMIPISAFHELLWVFHFKQFSC